MREQAAPNSREISARCATHAVVSTRHDGGLEGMELRQEEAQAVVAPPGGSLAAVTGAEARARTRERGRNDWRIYFRKFK